MLHLNNCSWTGQHKAVRKPMSRSSVQDIRVTDDTSLESNSTHNTAATQSRDINNSAAQSCDVSNSATQPRDIDTIACRPREVKVTVSQARDAQLASLVPRDVELGDAQSHDVREMQSRDVDARAMQSCDASTSMIYQHDMAAQPDVIDDVISVDEEVQTEREQNAEVLPFFWLSVQCLIVMTLVFFLSPHIYIMLVAHA